MSSRADLLEAIGWAGAALLVWTVTGLPIALALGRYLRGRDEDNDDST